MVVKALSSSKSCREVIACGSGGRSERVQSAASSPQPTTMNNFVLYSIKFTDQLESTHRYFYTAFSRLRVAKFGTK